ncbi:uncharacterized protein BJX67DRAFT_61491 [Aspergillus lucknowensis]|uniref:F-box domain-containing protein n=1 Tax=Aspergillus lucknowensis TaxID=176173 RepID=A0ABR4LVC2_9EURO
MDRTEFFSGDEEAETLSSMEIDSEETLPSKLENGDNNLAMEIDEIRVLRNAQRPAKTFFDLPEEIKIRILQYAGLLRPCLINFAYEKFRHKIEDGVCGNGNPIRMTRLSWTGTWVSPYHAPCSHPTLPLEVFLASRAARRELGTLFFAHNRFGIFLYGRSEYKLFCAATEWGLKHLRYLHLDLGPRENRYLKISGGVHRTIMNVWVKFCQNSKERMPALRCFSMKCKVKELDIASRLMCTMDPFPPLTHCAFHLNNNQDDDIRPVIKRAAWRLTGNLGNKSSFPFMKLPKEVQLMILEYVLLNRSDPYLPALERTSGLIGFLDRKHHRTVASPLSCCGTCSPVRAMCFCEARQTAFSTSCSCFSSPLPYFLVGRGFYEDSRRIFFSKNRFTFVEEDPESIMRILIPLPTSSFMQIRHLSFKFPVTWRILHKNAKTEEGAILSWCVLRRFIREHFDLPRLSLSIVDFGTTDSKPSRNRYMRKMLKAFTDLQKLREFRVYLADDPSFEKELERIVMGRASVGRYRPYATSST